METFLITFVFTLIIVSLVLAGISLRMLVIKGGEFRGGCATNSPILKNQIGECEVCGAKPDEQCKNELPPLSDKS